MRKNPTDPTMVGNLKEKVRKNEMNGKKNSRRLARLRTTI